MQNSTRSIDLVYTLAHIVAVIGYTGFLFRIARKRARLVDKPLLNVGCKSIHTGLSDVNLDIVPRQVPNFVQGDIQDLHMFTHKQFGAVFASHVLEHVDNPEAAVDELNRIAEYVFIVTPFPFFPWAWIHPDHRWILMGSKVVCRNPLFGWLG